MYRVKTVLQSLAGVAVTAMRIIRHPAVLKRNEVPKPVQKKILILGNGPSLRTFLEHKEAHLKDADVFAVNKFCLSDEYASIKPQNYVLVDSDFFLEDTDSSILAMKKSVIEKFETGTNWNMNLFLPNSETSHAFALALEKKNSFIKVYFFNMITIEGPESFKNFMFDKGIGMPFVGNVLIAANMLAIQMGYKRIELYGAEQSIHVQAYVNEEGYVTIGYSYFSGKNDEYIYDYAEAHGERQKYHEYMEHWVNTFKAYHAVASYAKSKNCKIINMTKESYIDAFEKIKHE